jgi:hypothetical protein
VRYTQRTAHLFENCREYYEANTVKGDGCWEWTGTIRHLKDRNRTVTPFMKVQIDNERPNINTHIFAYNLLHHPHEESPVSHAKGHEVRRVCGNRLCVNPTHMALGDRTDTIAAMKERGTTQTQNQHAKKYSHEDIREDYYENGMTYVQLMKKYDVKSKGTISHIINKAIDAKGKRE